ncbi:MAG: DUF4905 domain-containing protein [Bacteroidota bacterium]
MPFFRSGRRRSFRPFWEYRSKGVIWRLQPAAGGMLVGEERDLTAKTVAFFCIDLSNGRALWKEKDFGEQWWTGIEAVYRDTLILHGYATPDLPEPKGITAVDITTGRLLWRRDDLRCIATLNGCIRASRPAASVVEIDRRTGALVREMEGSESGTDPSAERSDEQLDDVVYPRDLEDDPAAFPERAELLRRVCSREKLAGPVSYIELGSAVVFGYSERVESTEGSPPTFRTMVALMARGESEPRFSATIDESKSFPVYGTFLVREGVLLFVRERSTLTAMAVRDM